MPSLTVRNTRGSYQARLYRKKKKYGKVPKKIQKYVKQKLDSKIEDKYLGFIGGPATAGTGGVTAIMNVVPQGVAVQQRIGNRIKCKSTEIFGICGAGSTPTRLRFILVWDKTPHQNPLLLTDLLGSAGTLVYSVYKFENVPDRFIILKDVTYAMNIYGGGTDRIEPRHFHWKVNLRGRQTVFDGTSGTYLDIVEGALSLVMISDNSTAGQSPSFAFTANTIYEDA